MDKVHENLAHMSEETVNTWGKLMGGKYMEIRQHKGIQQKVCVCSYCIVLITRFYGINYNVVDF